MSKIGVIVPGGLLEGEQLVVEDMADAAKAANVEAMLLETAAALRCDPDDLAAFEGVKYWFGALNANTAVEVVIVRRSAIVGLVRAFT